MTKTKVFPFFFYQIRLNNFFLKFTNTNLQKLQLLLTPQSRDTIDRKRAKNEDEESGETEDEDVDCVLTKVQVVFNFFIKIHQYQPTKITTFTDVTFS